MKKSNTNLAIIPARGGSKRLKEKNKLLLGDKPLVCYTIEAALNSSSITDVIVSSDSKDILNIAREYKGVILHSRSKELSKDHSTALELVNFLFSNQETKYDFLTLMLPTCPFRDSNHIDEAFKSISDTDDGIISVTEYGFPLELRVVTNDLYIDLPKDSPLVTGNTRSQNHTPALRPNGGFYLNRWSSFNKNRNFWMGNIKYYLMNREDSVDIDTKLDLKFAQLVLESKKNE